MKLILSILLFFSVAGNAQHVTFIWHTDTLWALNPSTLDSVMISPRPISWTSITSRPSVPASKGDISLGNVDNTSDANKPVSTATQNALDGKSATNHTHAYSEITSKPTLQGYTINVQALTSSPADGATVYFGMLPKAPVSAAATSKVHIRKSGTITAANIYCYSGTAGTNESWSLYVRVNNTTDYLIQTLSVSTSERIFTNSSLSIAVSAGDYIEIKSVNPTWATNPLTTIFGGYIYIE